MFLNAIISLIKLFSDVFAETCSVIKCHENKYKMWDFVFETERIEGEN